MKRPLIGLGLCAALVAGCGDDGGGGETCAAVGTGARGYDVLGYHLSARFDWTTATLTAAEVVDVACRGQALVELDAEVGLTAVQIAGRPAPFTVDDTRHTVTVDTGGTDGTVAIEFAYTAPTSDALLVRGPRDDDPVTTPVLFTDSEPDRGRRWLVGDHNPADRARFAVELTVAADQDVIANGERVDDRTTADGRVVSYAIDQPVPTYQMAFAAGALDHVERTTGRVPIAVWFRRGLALDAQANLDLIARVMATFEPLIGNYPWSRYAVVLLPQYGGGMENTTISFDSELSGQGVLGVNLAAHELAHQWFGDWVTMHGYDDVWVKEGMATLLAVEAERADRDRGHTGRWFGTDFNYNPDDAVVDPTLTGLDKYTSGPYDRAAWVMTQLRRKIGDDAYWAGARKVLADHQLGTITGEQFVNSFGLDAATAQRVLASLPKHGAPSISVTATPTAGGTTLAFGLDDPDQLVIAPIEVGAVDAAGVAGALAALPTSVTVPDGGYVAVDPAGVHPYWPYVFGPWNDYWNEVAPRMAPTAAAALTTFAGGAPAQQERGLDSGLPVAQPAGIAALYADLDSTEAQATAVIDACYLLAGSTGPEATALGAVLAPLLRTPAITRYQTGYVQCGAALAEATLGAELDTLAAAPTATVAARLDYLLSFDYLAPHALAQIGKVATTAPSLRLRDRAIARLASQVGPPYAAIDAADVPAWQAFFRDRYPAITSRGRLLTVWHASARLQDTTAVPLVAPLVRSVPLFVDDQVGIVCDAHDLADAAGWTAFGDLLQPWDTLPLEVRSILADPAPCATRRRAPAVAPDDERPLDHVRTLRAAVR